MSCKHEHFDARVMVNRLEDSGQFMADVTICCARCGVPFCFRGLKAGLDLSGAAVSPDGTEARLAIHPKNEPIPSNPFTASGFRIIPKE
jgi:hypothetical protein